ncbi:MULTISPECIES: tyrosinase cofactor [unclassified Streptomyces]|uniref:apotyrosinase chaperone MelC1 n=1 Tax=unclassified Streptomyces TaxID=2593676 RepID=UPI001F039F45|nr:MULTISPECIES: tyrosinase cofactor [unclassified Streptomyces]MCH0566598.1 tyrosinase cofactor [Streptomyces sp. MUM 2J]MCH0572164.1 tyrosinase cofactor [Streptomyces sp. MUM 136J]
MPELSRRRALTAAAALAATAAGAQALTALPAHAAEHPHDAPAPFDEIYHGRRIAGRPVAGGGHHHGGYAVFVDGVELHVMRNADGSWISVVSHYDPVATPRAAARVAVDELQGAQLLPLPVN